MFYVKFKTNKTKKIKFNTKRPPSTVHPSTKTKKIIRGKEQGAGGKRIVLKKRIQVSHSLNFLELKELKELKTLVFFLEYSL